MKPFFLALAAFIYLAACYATTEAAPNKRRGRRTMGAAASSSAATDPSDHFTMNSLHEALPSVPLTEDSTRGNYPAESADEALYDLMLNLDDFLNQVKKVSSLFQRDVMKSAEIKIAQTTLNEYYDLITSSFRAIEANRIHPMMRPIYEKIAKNVKSLEASTTPGRLDVTLPMLIGEASNAKSSLQYQTYERYKRDGKIRSTVAKGFLNAIFDTPRWVSPQGRALEERLSLYSNEAIKVLINDVEKENEDAHAALRGENPYTRFKVVAKSAMLVKWAAEYGTSFKDIEGLVMIEAALRDMPFTDVFATHGRSRNVLAVVDGMNEERFLQYANRLLDQITTEGDLFKLGRDAAVVHTAAMKRQLPNIAEALRPFLSEYQDKVDRMYTYLATELRQESVPHFLFSKPTF